MTILWDWNGTLLQDVDLALRCDEVAMKAFGYPPIEKEDYLRHFDFPVLDFYRHHGIRDEDYPAIAKKWNDAYQQFYPGTPLREDALDTLARFSAEGFTQAIISATEHTLLLGQTALHPSLTKHMTRIQGIENVLAVSKIQTAIQLLQDLGSKPEETYLIGDTLHDQATANALHCHCVLVEGGHQHADRLYGHGVPVVKSLTDAADFIFREVRHAT